MIFRFITSGESHGQCLNAIIEGLPSGIKIDKDYINNELKRRQIGYGRGGRMLIENDSVKILSGVRHGISTGAPVCLEIDNKDWQNWSIPMNTDEVELNDENIKLIQSKSIHKLRPGHADFAGAIKYNQKDIRDVLERSSARETASRVAVGAVAKLFLKQFGIEGISAVTQIGNVKSDIEGSLFDYKDYIENSDLRVLNNNDYELMKAEIDKAKQAGDTIGGSFKVVFKNVPIGLGSFVHWDRKLDGLIAQAVMSIPAVKSVEIGAGCKCAQTLGSDFHDEIYYENGKFKRTSNNAGGIEGGMSNGEDIVVSASMKPIPTMIKPLNSVDITTKESVKAHFERSDTCAVPACAVVAEAMIAIVIADAFLEKFSHDNMEEIFQNYSACLKRISER